MRKTDMLNSTSPEYVEELSEDLLKWYGASNEGVLRCVENARSYAVSTDDRMRYISCRTALVISPGRDGKCLESNNMGPFPGTLEGSPENDLFEQFWLAAHMMISGPAKRCAYIRKP